MKQLFTLFILALCLGVAIPASGQDLDSGLVVYYNFEGNLTDSISGTTAENVGNLTFADDDSKVGSQSVRFFNDGSYFKTPAEALIPGREVDGGTPASFALWVKHRGASLGTERQNYLAQEDGCDATGRVTLYLQAPGSSAKPDTIVSFVGNDRTSSEYSPVGMADEWIHLALTIDPETRLFNFYVNGLLTNQDSLTGGKQVEPSCGEYIVGHHKADDNESQTFDGLMDDLRFYNRVLTEAEVGLLAGLEPSGTREVLVASALSLSANPVSRNEPVTVGLDHSVFSPGSTVTLRVIDLSGRLVISRTYESISDRIQLQHDLRPGAYSVSVTDGHRLASGKLLVR
ncbi:hypothetical protein GGR28_001985 [Lewinella aquimaris]|uniref:LamG-like jellyroll fold domain-containing protein n=1 Tax=Neolewinella aquimaris TaxID=1835722 RepID=A0A840E6W8_9BACT|nr:LamG-like jellyroll fold domain-containing protein [Neolewinella aquimaris]MBB4079365.1 hypothetical protein [Neolewinella aquimaris]